jgi:hypothetical protein
MGEDLSTPEIISSNQVQNCKCSHNLQNVMLTAGANQASIGRIKLKCLRIIAFQDNYSIAITETASVS